MEIEFNKRENQFIWRVPNWMTRWGVILIFLIMSLIVASAYFIKYPQFIRTTAIITTSTPPINLIARVNGTIESLFVADGDSVFVNQPIALIRSSAKYKDIVQLEIFIKKITEEDVDLDDLIESEYLDGVYTLGELQSTFSEFLKICKTYKNYKNINHIGKKQQLLRQQINKGLQQYNLLKEQRSTYKKELDIASRSLKRDSTLFSLKTISVAEYERSLQQNLQKQETKSNLDANIVSTELGIMQTKQQIIELSIQQEKEIRDYGESLRVLAQQMLNMIKTWKEEYLISTPAEGKITFVNYWAENQAIVNGESLATVVPHSGIEIIGKMSIPTAGFGKVKENATVNVKLNGFPYMEYGMLKGRITRLSAVPDNNGNYRADIFFPEGLKTNYNKELPLIQSMDGIAEIITEDMRLIEHFWQPIKSVFNK